MTFTIIESNWKWIKNIKYFNAIVVNDVKIIELNFKKSGLLYSQELTILYSIIFNFKLI